MRNMLKIKQTAILLCLTLLTPAVMAFTAPTAGDFMYDLYDIFVNKGLNGAPGFVIGVALIGYSFTQMQTNWKLASLGVIGGSLLIKAADIATSLGAVI